MINPISRIFSFIPYQAFAIPSEGKYDSVRPRGLIVVVSLRRPIIPMVMTRRMMRIP